MLTPEQAQFVSGYKPVSSRSTSAGGGGVSVAPKVVTGREAVGWANISKQAKAVYEVVCIAHRAGVADLTGREIRAWWQKVHPGSDIDTSTISPRVNELISSGVLERLPLRHCTAPKSVGGSGKLAGPVRAVAQQTRLAA